MDMSNISLQYHKTSCAEVCLNCDEWQEMIHYFFNDLRNYHYGLLILDKFNECLSKYSVIITNKDPTNITTYPKTMKIEHRKIMIVIPSTPYFISTIRVSNTIFDRLMTCTSSTSARMKIIRKYEKYGKYCPQPLIITFIHELIHCIRFIVGYPKKYDEEAVIYGIDKLSLKIGNTYITENMFLKHYGLLPRISHKCRADYVLDVVSTHKNRLNFSKKSYYEYGLNSGRT